VAAEAPASGHEPSPDEESPPGHVEVGTPSSQIAAIEEHQRGLARFLNDGPSQTLSNIVLRAEMVERFLDSEPTRAREESQRLREAAVGALTEVRRFMFEAFPSVLEDLGLVSTLRRYLVSRGDRGGLAVEMRVVGEERRLDAAAELALFRTIQAGLDNVGQHSGATRADVALSFDHEAVEVTIADGGRGFVLSEATDSTEARLSGLPGARARLAAVGGELEVITAIGRGTTLRARVPS
jgi:two-component system, NarL family, sensor histidine kinase DegS